MLIHVLIVLLLTARVGSERFQLLCAHVVNVVDCHAVCQLDLGLARGCPLMAKAACRGL
jgi:hypothetical protein